MTRATKGYYAPLSESRSFRRGAWSVRVGTTPAGEHVVEFQSDAAPRYQREYYPTAADALDAALAFLRPLVSIRPRRDEWDVFVDGWRVGSYKTLSGASRRMVRESERSDAELLGGAA